MRRGAIIVLSSLWAGTAGVEAQAQSPELDCLIQPRQTVTLSFAVEGVVQEVLVDRGDLVERGQPLARLLADVERSSLAVARAQAEAMASVQGGEVQLEHAERTLKRQGALQEQHIVSEETMDQALREQRLAKAGLLDAQESKKVAELAAARAATVLRMRTVKSPVRGVVVKRILSPGEWADPPQVLELAEIDPLHVEVFAPLDLLGQIVVGARSEVLPESPVGGIHEAKVTVVDRVVDAASGTFGVRLELPNPDFALPAGVKCRVRFVELADRE